MADLENKRIFLIATAQLELSRKLEEFVKAHVPSATVFTAFDGIETLFKSENVPPHIVILDYQIPKMNPVTLTEKLISRKDRLAVIVLSPDGDQEHFMDEVVQGQVQFLSATEDYSVFSNHVTRALNWVAHEENQIYRLRFLESKKHLITQGEKGDFVYLVKAGELKAYKKDGDREIVLGTIHPGEFVGEMAYINGEARSAHVVTLTDCELIEIRSESLDAVLFSKPAWSRALVKTLSKRLKTSNEGKTVKS